MFAIGLYDIIVKTFGHNNVYAFLVCCMMNQEFTIDRLVQRIVTSQLQLAKMQTGPERGGKGVRCPGPGFVGGCPGRGNF